MGYSIFANRKAYYTDLIYDLNSQIDNITSKKQKLLDASSNIADGCITIEELASDPTNIDTYYDFLLGLDAYENTSNDDGGVADTTTEIGAQAVDAGYSDEDLATIAEMLDSAYSTEYAEAYNKKLEAEENKLDLQQKRLETKLTAAQNNLESVENAEGNAIQKSAPKFSGVGN